MWHLILLPGLYPFTARAQGDGGRKTELLQQTFPAKIDSQQPKKKRKEKKSAGWAQHLRLSLPWPCTLSPPSPRSAAGPSSSWCSCGGRTRPRWAPGWRWWIGRRWCQLLLVVSCRAAGGEDNINIGEKNIKKEKKKKGKGTRRECANEFSRPAAQLKKLLSHLRFNPVLLTNLSVATG